MVRASSIELLLGESLAPITSEIGFIDVAPDEIATAFTEWQRNVLGRGTEMTMKPVQGGLEAVLQSLVPLTSVQSTGADTVRSWWSSTARR